MKIGKHDSAPNGPPPRRLAIGVSLFFVTGCLITALFGFEFFPFSDYSMYSKTFTPKYYCAFTLYGHRKDNKELWKFPLKGIVSPAHTSVIIEILEKHLNRSQEKAQKIINGLYGIYEYRRTRYFPDFPKLLGLKFIRECWRWETFETFALSGQLKESYPPDPYVKVLLNATSQAD